jgi:hypothetical protein
VIGCHWQCSHNLSTVLTHSLKPTLGATKPATFPGDKTWEQWTSGNDTDSVWADPLFTDIQSGDYSLLPESPAFELGIHEIILGNFGVQESLRYASSLQ